MREERGTIPGDVVVYEPFTLWGTALGNVTVIDGGKLYARGLIHGDLIVEPGGRVHLFGTVSGSVHVHPDTKVILSGTVGRHAINHGGRLYIDATAKVMGRVITHAGKTRIQPPPGTARPARDAVEE
ncbi:MAG: hypothetical protein ACK4PI_10495 [Tepidisphaerales bacterium]